MDRSELITLYLALVLLPLLALGLRLFGLGRIQLTLERFGASYGLESNGNDASIKAGKAARMVAAAARYGPYRAKCLPVSLTLAWVLRRKGIETQLRLGVRKSASRLQAHAWIEHQGKPLIDPPDVHQRFAAFEHAIEPRSVTSR